MRGFCSTDRAQILRVVRFDFDLSTLKITALWLTQKWQKSAVENRGVVKPLKNRIFALGHFLIWKIIKRTPQGHYLGCFAMEKSRTHVFRRFSCNGTTPSRSIRNMINSKVSQLVFRKVDHTMWSSIFKIAKNQLLTRQGIMKIEKKSKIF